jgi:hypothetical protein
MPFRHIYKNGKLNNQIMKTLRNIAAGLMIAVTAFPASAQSDQSFNRIRIAGPSEVILRQGPVHSVSTEGNTITRINYNIDDNWLSINGASGEDIVVTAPDIKQIDISGIGSIESDGIFKVEELDLKVTGSGKIELDIQATKVKAMISGAGKIDLDGTADEMRVDISGSGKIDAEELKVKKCTANISGSGKCLVDVTDELNTNISGSGSVYYVTKPTNLNNNISGVGKVGSGDAVESDTTRIMFGKTKVLIIGGNEKQVKGSFKDLINDRECNEVKSHWAGFELGINTYVTSDNKTDLPPGINFLELREEKSIAVNFNVIDYEIELYRRNIMLVTGLGFTYNNYRFKSDTYLEQNTTQVTPVTVAGLNLKKNKLVASYLTVPLLLEFNTSQNADKTVHLAVGVIGGLRIGSHLKLVKEEGNRESKSKVFDDFNLNPFRYDATVRLGYRNFTVFGSYNMAGLFKDNKGPELYPVTVGLRVIGW